MRFSRKLIVRSVFVVLALIMGAWLAPTTNNFIFFVLVFIGGTLFHSMMSTRLKKTSPLLNVAVFYGVVIAGASFVMPFLNALLMGIAGLLFDPFNMMRDKEDTSA